MPTIATPAPSGKRTVKESFAQAKTGYVSIPAILRQQQTEKAILIAVRKLFGKKVGAFGTEFDDGKDYKANFKTHLAAVDCLIVVIDSTRVIGPQVLREIQAARRLGKPIVLYKVDENQARTYYGYKKGAEGELITLNKRSERWARPAPASREAQYAAA